jgi:hypothetical protein
MSAVGRKTRDRRFVTEHRGGPLSAERHRMLMEWARGCAGHVLRLYGDRIDPRITDALDVAKAWEAGAASIGDARKASLGAIAAAHEAPHPAAVAVARAVGHAVATAHMADHSLGAADYALKAVKAAGRYIEVERRWQERRLPDPIRALALSARKRKPAIGK